MAKAEPVEVTLMINGETIESFDGPMRVCFAEAEPGLECIPLDALREVARAMSPQGTGGRYLPNQWETDGSRPPSVHIDHASNHLRAYDMGETADRHSGLHPLAHVAARILMALALELRKRTPVVPDE